MTRSRIAIVTLPGRFNYGNRLQAYALSKVVRDVSGKDVVHVIPFDEKNPILRWAKITLTSVLSGNVRSLMMKVKKDKAINPFSRQYLKEDVWSSPGQYTHGITGSDQVWHPAGIKKKNINRYFLTKLPSDKRIAYAPSFGLSEIPEEKLALYKTYLPQMRWISSRETSGAILVRDITGRNIPVVLDPTLLLSAEEWADFTSNLDGKLVKKRYIVRYTLGRLSNSEELQISTYAKNNRLDVYQVMGDSMESGGGGRIPTVQEFLARIKNGEVVITDSFHACVFSTILHTPFVALKRPGADMSSRITTLLSETGMLSSMYDGKTPFEEIIEKTSFDNVDTRIESRRKESIDFLRKALGVKSK